MLPVGMYGLRCGDEYARLRESAMSAGERELLLGLILAAVARALFCCCTADLLRPASARSLVNNIEVGEILSGIAMDGDIFSA